MICHDSSGLCPNGRPPGASFALPNTHLVERPSKGVGSMVIQHNRLPQLFNWLAVVVLLSLGVLL